MMRKSTFDAAYFDRLEARRHQAIAEAAIRASDGYLARNYGIGRPRMATITAAELAYLEHLREATD